MAGRLYARPLTLEDQEALAEIDERYALCFGLERVVTPGSLGFYARSGHAFVSCYDERPSGFVLAHAVWNGSRPVVQASRLALQDAEDAESRAALVEALTRSAYDAAVYDIHLFHPDGDGAGGAVLAKCSYQPTAQTLFVRVLGSRAQKEA